MRKETEKWLIIAEENLEAARVLLNNSLFNPCLQNIQQSIEKGLKAIFIEKGIKLKKTHSITELNNILQLNKINVDLTEDECDLLDSIYLPSKYPLGSVLPNFEPDIVICRDSIKFNERIINSIKKILS